jgi:hypothetical protein
VSLEKIRKVAPNGKEVLNNINLGMYLVRRQAGGQAAAAGRHCSGWDVGLQLNKTLLVHC